MKKYDFFISYNSNDASHAKRLSTIIKNNDLNCWWQKDDSKQEYAVEIHEAIRSSYAFIVLLSPNSAGSEWVGREIFEAIRLYTDGKLKILPIVVEDLTKNDTEFFHHILGKFNWLFLSDYSNNRDLIVAITNQVNVSLKEKSTNSIYSAQEEIEQERLRKQNNLYNMYASKHLDDVFKELKSPAVLDVGSCDGENIIRRLEGREYSHLLLVDKNAEKLDEAEKRYPDKRHNTMCVDITSKGFIDKIKEYLTKKGLDGFNLIHISSVLLHLKNPLSVLKALRQLLSDDGYIFVQDEDDGFNVAYQEQDDEPSFFKDCFYIWKYSKESGDRAMARKLPIYLKKAGFQGIELKSTVMSSVDFGGALKEDLWDMYFNPDYWVVDSEDYFYKKDAYEKFIEYKNKHKKMKQRYMKNQIFLTIGVLFYIAKK